MKRMMSGGAALGALAIAVTAAVAQTAPKPKIEAVYWLSAETVSGMATGQPTGVEKNLSLQLGSVRSNSAPSAEHLPPQGLRAGDRLPLVSPKGGPPRSDSTPDFRPGTPDKPKGRIELYWGCGETAPAGQPVVIDLATMKPGAASPFGAIPNVRAMVPPSAGRHATYGEWPGGKNGTRVPRAGSLTGDHVVQGNYSPEMRFAVAAGNDFLAPLAPRSAELASGAVKVSWPVLANARGYIMTVTGARAYGPEANYGSPREVPAGWSVKLRTKATHMGMLGVDLSSLMAGGGDSADGDTPASDAKPKKKRGLLRGIVGGALGVPG